MAFFTVSTTLSTLIPSESIATEPGALVPKRSIPTLCLVYLGQPNVDAASTDTIAEPAGSTYWRCSTDAASNRSQEGIETTLVSMPDS